ncbi:MULTISPECIES: GntR family transcriptional regulator [Streptomycetaceae]|uniref:Transcriptional regulator n=1 Tax=Streptantibioticus cattleyicolor (strain ATCC 35852 / DSM 46488 / JCM 4925 / NBRC 14057 / NRRL 8057) TaxID=1003195 RepID=F8JVK0_STREN|nr:MULTISPECIES: GntR family transcriptional regulator [Streptomycetaceae]AEW95698.1 transcriptional regulator [Streptantibioticus cattleyicolor NRRL 8057 = DSM 46488]MYS60245.1 GntR family transcriptional regulator [Streptomyces sp. SID5468]CCB76037.1 GntR-family transcriptional regulator [Streptantibioticus cattleyicolor NRRL 8057 = DSM 46488]
MPGSTPVRRSSLRQQIADALRDEVLTGRLPSGRRFTVKEIADLYGVSATPVREALVDLAAQGLLEVEHHRGFQVREFTHADYRGLVEARILVTEGIFRRLTDRGLAAFPPEAMASVRRRAEAAVSAVRAGALDVLIGCDQRFWRELALLAENSHISEFLERLRAQSWVFAVPFLRAERDLSQVCWTGHVVLADAIRDGDAEATRRLVSAYNEHALTLIDRLTDRG